jgi:hypothetical protein
LHELVVAIVGSSVIPHLPDVHMEFFWFFVDVVVEFELNGLYINRIGDDIVVVGRAVSALVDWF